MTRTTPAGAAMAASASDHACLPFMADPAPARRSGGTRLVAEIAAEAGVSEHQVRLALSLRHYADRDAAFGEAVAGIRKSRGYLQRVARSWRIDFADYTPYAHRRVRPAPIGRLS